VHLSIWFLIINIDEKQEVINYDEEDARLKFVGTLKSNSRAFGTLFMKNKEIYRGHLQNGLKVSISPIFYKHLFSYKIALLLEF